MSPHRYPRQRKQLIALNGIFDDFSDNVFSAARWFNTYTGSQVTTTFVTAPGGIGGYALRLLGTIANGLDPMIAQGGVSPYPNKSKLYYINPGQNLKWSMKAEFRLRIATDQTDSTNKLAHSAGFALDGNVNWSDDHNEKRTVVYFSVANQRAGIVSGPSAVAGNELASVAWSGNLNTWYDIRIEWEYDWFYWTDYIYFPVTDERIQLPVKVYVNNELLIDVKVYLGEWRQKTSVTVVEFHAPLGRCGPHINVEDEAALTGQSVDAYYKDILITNSFRYTEYEWTSSVLSKGASSHAKATLRADSPHMINEGDDFQIWERDNTSADWSGSFRGIIRQVSRLMGKLVVIEAEGYESVFYGARGENLSYTTKTTGFIVNDVLSNPDTFLFDTSTYFDSTSTTYSRNYLMLPKLDIIAEMSVLENFIIYLDAGNCWHFQSILTNDTDVYLRWGKDKITSAHHEDNFVRTPNFLRVVGSGVYAERELSSAIFESSSRVTRTVQRLDLTTQAEVEAALDYYISNYLEPVKLLDVKLRANHAIKKGKIIRVYLPTLGIINAAYLVVQLFNNSKQQMNARLIEVKPNLPLLLADLEQRASRKEDETVPTDDLSTDEKLHVEGSAKLMVSAYYAIVDNQSGLIAREGQAIVTDYTLQWILELLNNEYYPSGRQHPSAMHVGTGTTPEKPSDTALENRTTWSYTSSEFEDIAKQIGSAGSATSYFLGNCYKMDHWQPGSNISEIGLFRDSTESDMFVRAVFPAYTPGDSWCDMYIWIKFMPVPGPCMFSFELVKGLTYCFYTNALAIKLAMERGMVVASDTFTVPDLYINEETETSGKVVICPKLLTDGTLTRTKIVTKHMMKYDYTYTFDYTNDRYNPADGDKQIFAIGLTFNDYNKRPHIFMFYRTAKMLSELDGHNCHFILWIKILRGDFNLTPVRSWETDDS